MQPTHCISDKRFYEKRIGPERCKGAYAWRSLADAGADLAFGTDYQVEPLNPMEGLYAAVSRKDRLGEDGEGWFPEQKITMEEAIKYYTLGSAYAQFMEDRKGMIKPGYLADIVITDKDLLTIPENEIMKTKVDYTITGGKIVYASTIQTDNISGRSNPFLRSAVSINCRTKKLEMRDEQELTIYFESEYNIFIASSGVDPQNCGSALKSSQTFGLAGSL